MNSVWPRWLEQRLYASADVIRLRAAAFAASTAVALVLLGADPQPVSVGLTAGAIACALIACLATRGIAPTGVLALLVTCYAVDTSSTGTSGRIVSAAALATALWIVHTLYALTAAVPRDAKIDTKLVNQWRRNLAGAVATSLPLTAAIAAVGLEGPHALWLSVLGVAAAILIAALPLLLTT